MRPFAPAATASAGTGGSARIPAKTRVAAKAAEAFGILMGSPSRWGFAGTECSQLGLGPERRNEVRPDGANRREDENDGDLPKPLAPVIPIPTEVPSSEALAGPDDRFLAESLMPRAREHRRIIHAEPTSVLHQGASSHTTRADLRRGGDRHDWTLDCATIQRRRRRHRLDLGVQLQPLADG